HGRSIQLTDEPETRKDRRVAEMVDAFPGFRLDDEPEWDPGDSSSVVERGCAPVMALDGPHHDVAEGVADTPDGRPHLNGRDPVVHQLLRHVVRTDDGRPRPARDLSGVTHVVPGRMADEDEIRGGHGLWGVWRDG